MNKREKQAGLPDTPGYVYANKIGNQLFISGQVPHDRSGQLVGQDDAQEQTKQCLLNLGLLLQMHHFTIADIQKMTIYVVGKQDNLAGAWSVIRDTYPDGVPPATLIGVAALGHEGQLVEIDATILRESWL